MALRPQDVFAASKSAPAAAPAAPEPVAEGFTKMSSGMQIQEVSKPQGMENMPTNVLKAGDYIRVDYKLYLDEFGKTLIEDTDKTGAVTFQIGTGTTSGDTGMKKVKDIVAIPSGLDEACLGQIVGTKRKLIIPNAFPMGTTTLAGVAVPKGATVYYEMRVRARVFASIVGGAKQENFLEDDQIEKINKFMGIGI